MSLPERALRAVRQRARTQAFGRDLTVTPRDDVVGMGLPYGRWAVPASLIDADSACYLAGIGKDISFDLGLIARFGCTVHAFDPVPEAIAYARAAAAAEPRFVLHPAGLWSQDGSLRFYDHREPGFVSHSATDMHDTGTYFEAPVRSVASLMREFGHDHVDLLKLSVEGSEYEIVGNVLDQQLDVRVLCVEFAQPAPRRPIDAAVARLRAAGYELVEASLPPWGWKLTFMRAAS
jgi:FkbM family methyltransferase